MQNESQDPTLDYCKAHIEAFRAELDRSTDGQRYFLRSVVGIGSFLIVGLGASAVYLLGQSVSDLKKEVSDLASTRVQAEITNNASTVKQISEISNQLSDSLVEYENNKHALRAIESLASLEKLGAHDPFGIYQQLSRLDDKASADSGSLSEEERAAAFSLLQKALDAGVKGITEPNILFNTTVIASRLDFNSEAVKLATLAHYWLPSSSHATLRAEYSTLYGISFEFNGSEFVQIDKPSAQVRSDAWDQLKEEILKTPRQECEQIYSRAQNVAVRFRFSGYYGELIDTIHKSALENENLITSYGLNTLATLYTYQSNTDWEYNYWTTVEKALEKLSMESPVSSWYNHTVRDSLRSADRIGKAEELMRLASSKGLPDTIWQVAFMSNGDSTQDH